jgi:membrane protein insertase Oxa1/YidC/SpoIIIJ
MPIISLPITAMFPAAINMYWITVSFVQCLTVGMMHTRYFKEKIGVINKVVKPKPLQAVIVEEKRSQNSENEAENKTNFKPTFTKEPFITTKSG